MLDSGGATWMLDSSIGVGPCRAWLVQAGPAPAETVVCYGGDESLLESSDSEP